MTKKGKKIQTHAVNSTENEKSAFLHSRVSDETFSHDICVQLKQIKLELRR